MQACDEGDARCVHGLLCLHALQSLSGWLIGLVARGLRGVDLLLHTEPMPPSVNDSCMRRMPFRSPFDYFMGQLWGLNHKPSRLFHEKAKGTRKVILWSFFLSATQYISLTSVGGHFIFGLVSYVGVVRKKIVPESKRYSRGGSTVRLDK